MIFFLEGFVTFNQAQHSDPRYLELVNAQHLRIFAKLPPAFHTVTLSGALTFSSEKKNKILPRHQCFCQFSGPFFLTDFQKKSFQSFCNTVIPWDVASARGVPNTAGLENGSDSHSALHFAEVLQSVYINRWTFFLSFRKHFW